MGAKSTHVAEEHRFGTAQYCGVIHPLLLKHLCYKRQGAFALRVCFSCCGFVTGLLLFPDHDDPLDSTLALQMYEAAIIEHVKAHARWGVSCEV